MAVHRQFGGNVRVEGQISPSGGVAGYAPSAHTHAAADIADATTPGKALLTSATIAAQRTALGLGTAATLNVAASGDASASEVVKGDDSRLSGSGSGDAPFAVASFTAVTSSGEPEGQTLDGAHSVGVSAVTRVGAQVYQLTLDASAPAGAYKRVELAFVFPDDGTSPQCTAAVLDTTSWPSSGTTLHVATSVTLFDGLPTMFRLYNH